MKKKISMKKCDNFSKWQVTPIFIATAYSRVRYRSSNFCPSVRPSSFTSKFSFLDISDSCESETLHSNCPWHTLQARILTQYPWPIFYGPLTLKIFTSRFAFLNISDSCESEILHSNCPWHTLQARTLTQYPCPIFHGSLTLKIFTPKFAFLDISDSCESETLHSNCLWHTL